MSVVKYGFPVPAANTTTRPFLEVAHGASPDEWLRDSPHLDGGRYPRDDSDMLERVLEGERVDHRGEHAHVVGRGALHALGAGREPAEQVAAADHDGGLHAHPLYLADVFCDLSRHAGIDPERLLSHEGLTGELQKDATEDGTGHDGDDYINVRSGYRGWPRRDGESNTEMR